MKTRRCSSCKKHKDISYFYKQVTKRINKAGDEVKYNSYQSQCKPCKGVGLNKPDDYVSNAIYHKDLILMDTMIEIYQKKGFNNITEAFKKIGKKELKELAYKKLNYDNTKTQF